MSDTLVIIPTYNEKENIEAIIKTVFEQYKKFHILVVDDNSPDGTAAIVDDLILRYSDCLFIEKREGKNGLGTAYIHGFKWAIEKKYDYIIEMDADFSHNPADLVRLYNACESEGADVSIGSRYSKGVNVVNWPYEKSIAIIFCIKICSFYYKNPCT
jgi:dolichol-phosphate mannosyltransferase